MSNTKLVELTEELIKGLEAKGETLKEITDIDSLIGQSFLIRTVTYFLVGKLEQCIGGFWRLSEASWIADTGRFADAIAKGTLGEVEPVGTAFVNSASIVDFFPWSHSLPTEQR